MQHPNEETLLFHELEKAANKNQLTEPFKNTFEKGQCIIHDKTIHPYIYYFSQGIIGLYTKQNNEYYLVSFTRKNRFGGLLDLYSGQQSKYMLKALTWVECLCINRTEFIKLIDTTPALAHAVIEQQNRAATRIAIRLIMLQANQSKKTVLYFLYFFVKDIVQTTTFTLPITRCEMANFLLMSERYLRQHLNELKDEGFVDYKNDEFTLYKMAELQELFYE